ncbi:MAG: DnaJ domain-containing protein [Desulfovibrionaceae bacterium]
MYTRTQREGGASSQANRGATDWHALEVQLNRTRSILQEILVHLQEVLRNLKMARNGSSGVGSTSRAEAGSSRFTSQNARTAGTNGNRFRAQSSTQGQSTHFDRSQPPHQGGAHASGTGTAGATNTGDRFRSRTRPSGYEARTEASGHARASTTFDKAKAESARNFRTNTTFSRSTTGSANAGRERPRTENTWRTKTQTAAGPEREARANTTHGPSASQRPASSRPSARPQPGFRMDQERQHRAREVARKNGMNLKCAYDILCLDYPCSADEIKVAYRQMARLHHPDLGGDEEAMKDVNVAYEMAMRFCAGPRRASAAWAV